MTVIAVMAGAAAVISSWTRKNRPKAVSLFLLAAHPFQTA
jgi:hypothetical protein